MNKKGLEKYRRIVMIVLENKGITKYGIAKKIGGAKSCGGGYHNFPTTLRLIGNLEELDILQKKVSEKGRKEHRMYPTKNTSHFIKIMCFKKEEKQV